VGWSTTSVLETDVGPAALWSCAFADPAAWPRWDLELLDAEADGLLRKGAVVAVRRRVGGSRSFAVTEATEGGVLALEARLTLARLRVRHELAPVAGGGARVTSTVALDGPLARWWARRIGPRVQRTLPTAQRAAAALARRG
jgi:hypothetical protein